jgi:hypothetical protein
LPRLRQPLVQQRQVRQGDARCDGLTVTSTSLAWRSR